MTPRRARPQSYAVYDPTLPAHPVLARAGDLAGAVAAITALQQQFRAQLAANGEGAGNTTLTLHLAAVDEDSTLGPVQRIDIVNGLEPAR